MTDQRRTAWLIAATTTLRLGVAALLPLGVDESYAVVVSRTLSLSYFDHPPAAFWIVHAAAQLAGEHPLAVRWPFVLLFALTSWLLFRLTARLFGARAGFWSVVAAQCIPVFSLSSGSWVLPDGPLLCASVAAALALSYAVPVSGERGVSDRPPRWSDWITAGVALGCAGLSKYHAALLGIGVAVFLLTDTAGRRWLTRPHPYVALVLAALCVIPVFVWNANHHWISFRFQGSRAAGSGNPLNALLQNLAGQAGYLLPWFWAPLLVLMFRGVRTGPRDRATWFCVCLGALPVVVFTLAALGGRAGLPHWPAPGFFLLLPLLGAAIARWEARAPAVAHRRMTLAATVFALLLFVVVSHATTGWVATVVPSLRRKDPAFELLEYRSIRDALGRDSLLQRARYVATNDWLRGAKIGYALGATAPTLVLNDDARHFQFATDSRTLVGTDGLLIVRVPMPVTGPETWITVEPFLAVFDTVRLIRTVPVLRGSDTALTVALFATSNFRRPWAERAQGLPPAAAPAPTDGHAHH
jgi:4-amino-4-deoxy-L-arabinose transferase-like glycosyltransferase